mgnify:FL=1
MPEEIRKATQQIGKDIKFSSLPEKTQEALFYIDAEMGKIPLDKVASGEMSSFEAWLQGWNQDPLAQRTMSSEQGTMPNPNFNQEVFDKREEEWQRGRKELFNKVVKEIDLESLPKPKPTLEARLKARREVNA